MKHPWYGLLFVGLLLVVTWLFFPVAEKNLATNDSEKPVELIRPSFIDVASVSADEIQTLDLGTLLDNEAGIAAYYLAPQTINLSQVRPLYKTIEMETNSFIIGSIAIPNYDHDLFDAHVYINTNGWILAYYMQGEPVSKIVDLYNLSIENTTLRTVIALVAGTAGAPFTDVTYYHFGYPNATNILFVYEDASQGGNQFSINMPGGHGYFERSWTMRSGTSLGCSNSGYYFRVNGVGIPYTFCATVFPSGDRRVYYGPIPASDMLPNVTHEVTVSHKAVLAILYSVPQ
jgi:hypothetical protein